MCVVLNIDVSKGDELRPRRQRLPEMIVDNNFTVQLNLDAFNQALKHFSKSFLVINLQLCKVP